MIDDHRELLGKRVRVTAHIPKGASYLETVYEGTAVRFGQQKTGSWFAHSKDKKLWIDRLELRMDDGEIRVCNLDQFTRIDLVGDTEDSAA